jgi:peptidoglycan hydrolase-like protein with peptidoglycan-binding domain
MLHDDRRLDLVVAFVRFTLEAGNGTCVGYAPPWPGRIFTLRSPLMQGSDVGMWQEELAQRGHTLTIDGYYGPESERVCRSFQEAHGLVIDGRVDPTTWHVTWATARHGGEAALTGASRAVTGMDRPQAPTLDEALEIRRRTGASWWGVYVGGPCSAGQAWTPETVRDLGRAGFNFLPIFVGQNDVPGSHARLFTRAQGIADGGDATRLMHEYGWRSGEQVPICLDVEAVTYENQRTKAIDYVAAWTSTVRAAGYQPMLYSSPSCLADVDRLAPSERPDGVWVARWLGRRQVDHSLSPDAIPQFPSDAWAGARVWQYEGDLPVPSARGAVDVSCTALPLAPAPH